MPRPTRNCRGLAADWLTKSAKPSLEVINASLGAETGRDGASEDKKRSGGRRLFCLSQRVGRTRERETRKAGLWGTCYGEGKSPDVP